MGEFWVSPANFVNWSNLQARWGKWDVIYHPSGDLAALGL